MQIAECRMFGLRSFKPFRVGQFSFYMIRPLRQRHRMLVLTLSAFLPAAFVLGIASRRSVPLLASVPSGLSPQPARTYQPVWVREDLWEHKPLRTRLLSDPM